MTIRKTDADVKREQEAHAMTAKLVGTGISVVGGGRKGPYAVVVNWLSKKDALKVVDAILEATGCKPEPSP